MRLCFADRLAIVWAMLLTAFMFLFVFAGSREEFFSLGMAWTIALMVALPWAFLRLLGWLFLGERRGA